MVHVEDVLCVMEANVLISGTEIRIVKEMSKSTSDLNC